MRGYTSLEIGTIAHGTSIGSNADENGSHPSVTESRDSVPVTKTVFHPEPLFSYWQQLCSLAIALRGGSPSNSPPPRPRSHGNLNPKATIAIPAQHLGNQPHRG